MNFPTDWKPGDVLKHTETWEWARGIVAPPPPPPPPPAAWTPPPLRVLPGDTGYTCPDLGPLLFPPPKPTSLGQSLWGLRVDALPAHRLNGQWMAAIGAGPARHIPLHPDFTSATYGAGIPLNVATADTPLRPVRIARWPDESDVWPGGYPVPDRAWVESGSDKHLIVFRWQPTSGVWQAIEFAGFRVEAGQYACDNVAVWDFGADAQRRAGDTSADGAGLCVAAGLARWQEITTGSIRHALRCTVFATGPAAVPPASHRAGSDPLAPPMGARLRLKPSVDLSTFSVEARVVLQGLKEYGLIVADNSGSPDRVYVTGEPSPDINDDRMGDLKRVHFPDDFEFVDAQPAAPPAA